MYTYSGPKHQSAVLGAGEKRLPIGLPVSLGRAGCFPLNFSIKRCCNETNLSSVTRPETIRTTCCIPRDLFPACFIFLHDEDISRSTSMTLTAHNASKVWTSVRNQTNRKAYTVIHTEDCSLRLYINPNDPRSNPSW